MTDTALQRYIALRKAGDLQGALAAAHEACAATPNMPTAHYALGEISSALGDEAGAMAAFMATLRLAPGWADAWVNLGLVRYRQGAVGAAKMAMREALRVQPGHAAAAGNLGALMRISGEVGGSEMLLRATLERAPENEVARLNLVADLINYDRNDEALALLDTAPRPPTAGAQRQWHLARTAALLHMGRTAEAREAMATFAAIGPIPQALAPLWHWRRLLLAELTKDGPEAHAAARDMTESLEVMGPDAVPEHRIVAHFGLARYCSIQGDSRATFEHLAEGHRLLRQSQPFSREAFAAVLAGTKAAFTTERLQHGPRASNRDPAPVFIVGMPRSGTTLCEQILASHGQVHGAGERVDLPRIERELGPAPRIAALDGAALDQAATRYLADLHALAPGKSRIVDKMTGNELHLGLVGLMLPGAKIIHCVRDPRDIGFSIWTFRFHGEHPYAHDLADLGWTIAQRAKLVDYWRTVLPNPILTVALQDWVNDFDGTLARVLTHLDLPPDPACARFYENDRDVRTVSHTQVRQPVHAKGLGRWRPHAKELAPLIAELEKEGMV